jgi:biotin synthase
MIKRNILCSLILAAVASPASERHADPLHRRTAIRLRALQRSRHRRHRRGVRLQGRTATLESARLTPMSDANPMSVDEASHLLWQAKGAELQLLLDRAGSTRAETFGTKVGLCAIVNAKSGVCGEDCRFCTQSVQSSGPAVPIHGFLPARTLVEQAVKAEKTGATSFSIVTSGRSIGNETEMADLEAALRGIAEKTRLRRCASLGFMDETRLRRLQRAGLQRYHHNVETSRSHFPSICSTHTFEQKLATLQAAKAVGLSVCSGGIFGVGETPEHRAELANTLRELGVDAVPINFLDARPGTPLAAQPRLPPEECLAIIAVFRLMLPKAEIIVMGGREAQLGAMKSSIFRAGANATLVGDYLTTQGSQSAEILAMVADQGLTLERPAGTKCSNTKHPLGNP